MVPSSGKVLLHWLSHYQRQWLKQDLLAGCTLAAYAVPVSLAYASLAGLPPEMGLYCYFAGGFGYALFGSSKHLAIGPTSAISLLLGVTLLELAGSDPTRIAGWASLTAIFMAAVFGLAWIFRLSFLVNFISESILTGFKAGAALVIAATQLPKLLGLEGGGDDFFERVGRILGQLGSTQWLPLSLGTIAIIALLLGDRKLPGRPVALVVILLSIFAVRYFELMQFGIRIVGDIPAGLPELQVSQLGFKELHLQEVRQLFRLACACFLLSYIESVSAARTYALKHRYDIHPRQELLALGFASLMTGLFQGYPIAGGLSQTAVNERAGAKTPLALIVSSLAIGGVLLFLTEVFRFLPDAVLAAVVLVAILGLINIGELRHLWRVSPVDFTAALIALMGVLCLGVLDGVLVAVLASLGLLLWRCSFPPVTILGRIPGTKRFSDIARHPDNLPLPGILAFRVQSSLLYFNAEQVYKTVLDRIHQATDIRRVVGDLSNVPYLDISGARILRRLHRELAEQNISFQVAEAHGPVRDMLRREGLGELLGNINRHVSLADLIDTKPENLDEK